MSNRRREPAGEDENCNCPYVRDSNGACLEKGPNGGLCNKPPGHDGPHASCFPPFEHPHTVWGDNDE